MTDTKTADLPCQMCGAPTETHKPLGLPDGYIEGLLEYTDDAGLTFKRLSNGVAVTGSDPAIWWLLAVLHDADNDERLVDVSRAIGGLLRHILADYLMRRGYSDDPIVQLY